MSFSDILGIIGIVITVILGVAGIYFAIRRTKYPAKITFVREQSVALLEDFSKKIPNLAVLYKDIPIEKNVVLISGYLVNEGSMDITKEMTEQPLRCVLPGECMWLEFKVTSVANELQVSSRIVDNYVEIQLGLFRCNESFSFQSLVSLDDKYANQKVSAFTNEISWIHRIASLGEIKTIQMPQQQAKTKKMQWLRRGAFFVLACLYLGLGITSLIKSDVINKCELEIYDKKTNVTLDVNGKINSHGADKNNLLKMQGDISLKKIKFEDKNIESWITTLVFFLGGIIILITTFNDDYKLYRIKKLIAASSEEKSKQRL